MLEICCPGTISKNEKQMDCKFATQVCLTCEKNVPRSAGFKIEGY